MVEGARLLSVYRSNAPIEGSNPSLSADCTGFRPGFPLLETILPDYTDHRYAPVAQGIERWVADPKAAGSNPARRTE